MKMNSVWMQGLNSSLLGLWIWGLNIAKANITHKDVINSSSWHFTFWRVGGEFVQSNLYVFVWSVYASLWVTGLRMDLHPYFFLKRIFVQITLYYSYEFATNLPKWKIIMFSQEVGLDLSFYLYSRVIHMPRFYCFLMLSGKLIMDSYLLFRKWECFQLWRAFSILKALFEPLPYMNDHVI